MNRKQRRRLGIEQSVVFGNVTEIAKNIDEKGPLDLLLFNVSCEMTTPELIDVVRQWSLANQGRKAELSVSGWDDDPRELRDIPEALALFGRMIDVGLLTILTDGHQLDRQFKGAGIGAFHIWAWYTKAQDGTDLLGNYEKFMQDQRVKFLDTCLAKDGQNRLIGKSPE